MSGLSSHIKPCTANLQGTTLTSTAMQAMSMNWFAVCLVGAHTIVVMMWPEQRVNRR